MNEEDGLRVMKCVRFADSGSPSEREPSFWKRGQRSM